MKETERKKIFLALAKNTVIVYGLVLYKFMMVNESDWGTGQRRD